MIKIATRGSDLALWQAHFFQSKLKELGEESEINIIQTKGDRIQDLTFDKIEGKGFFTKEIEEALLSKQCHVAIHSLKDLPTENPRDLILAGVSERANPHDCILMPKAKTTSFEELIKKDGAIIGTSSARRKMQIGKLAPKAEIKPIRGNVPTRIEKLRKGDFDAIILAKAGLDRLELKLDDLIVHEINFKEMVPAPGQGVLGYQCREDDPKMRELISKISSQSAYDLVNIERTTLNLIDGGCQTPFGAYCHHDESGTYHLEIAYAKDETEELTRFKISQNTHYQLAEMAVNQLNICT